MNGAKATAKYVRVSSTKASVVLDLIRGKSVGEAFAILEYTPRKAAEVILKVLKSAVANAEENHEMDVNRLFVAEAYVGQGPTLKRFKARAQGRGFRILKRTSHITLVVEENK